MESSQGLKREGAAFLAVCRGKVSSTMKFFFFEIKRILQIPHSTSFRQEEFPVVALQLFFFLSVMEEESVIANRAVKV